MQILPICLQLQTLILYAFEKEIIKYMQHKTSKIFREDSFRKLSKVNFFEWIERSHR